MGEWTGTYDKHQSHDLSSATRLVVEIMNSGYSANRLVGCAFSAKALGSRHCVGYFLVNAILNYTSYPVSQNSVAEFGTREESRLYGKSNTVLT